VEFFSRNIPEALTLYRELAAHEPDGGGSFYGCTSFQSVLGRLQQLAGDKSAESTLRQCLVTERSALLTNPEHPETLYRLAAIESSLGEIEVSCEYLKQAFLVGWLDYRSLQLDPRFDALRSDSHYQELLKEMSARVNSLRKSISRQL
jgi:hypothetical protein